jgi:hypothetical protein
MEPVSYGRALSSQLYRKGTIRSAVGRELSVQLLGGSCPVGYGEGAFKSFVGRELLSHIR